MLHRLLRDIAALPELAQAQVIVTLNLAGEAFNADAFAPLKIRVLRNDRAQGFGANHNAAFRLCRTPWFAVLNPDLRIPNDPFPTLLEVAARWPDVAAVAPTVVASDGVLEDAVRANLTPASLFARRLLARRKPMTVETPAQRGGSFYWLAGMFLLLRSDAYRGVGGFDERFFMYCEDYDLCARLYMAGYALAVASDAKVIHDAQRSSHRSWSHLRWHMTSLLRVWRSRAFWQVSLCA
jgi:N-acetylglucosaminyl-diphospho-decaprenol L-rhamnosyltransferase